VHVDADRKNSGISYVPQDASLLPWRTARQNACVGMELKKEAGGGSLSAVNLEFLDSLFDDWRLKGFEDKYPSELSGGMAQRVALIRALVSRPSILLCDEPFSAIDFVTRLRLNTEFKSLCKVRQITTVFVTHNIEEAIFLGTKVVVMSGRPGRVVSSYQPRFSKGGNNAVECRQSPEFEQLFQSVWQDLEEHHA
jgi:NitT/TauT family transport system ATP-binding protein